MYLKKFRNSRLPQVLIQMKMESSVTYSSNYIYYTNYATNGVIEINNHFKLLYFLCNRNSRNLPPKQSLPMYEVTQSKTIYYNVCERLESTQIPGKLK